MRVRQPYKKNMFNVKVFGRSVDQNMGTMMAYPLDEEGSEIAFTEPMF